MILFWGGAKAPWPPMPSLLIFNFRILKFSVVLMLIFNAASFSIGSFVKIGVRISYFAEINDKSELYMVDSLDEPLKKSGRLIISELIDLGRNSFATRTLLKHNDSQLVNSIQETFTADPPYGKVENYYDIVCKVTNNS